MRILYGVTGEGMGHAMRSRVVLDALAAKHEIRVVVSGRAADYLAQRSSEVLSVRKIHGYTLAYKDNQLRKWRTVVQNLKGALRGLPKNIYAYLEMAEEFRPDLVITDFESWSYLFGLRHELPIVSIDNMQIINRCEHAPELLAGCKRDFRLTNAVVKAKIPGAFHYHITTFFYPPTRKPNTTLHPPILRPQILAARPEPGQHLLVYQTSTSNEALPEILKRCGRECRVYGLRRDIESEVVDGNLRYRPFSEAGFIEDLRTAVGVVASAGFTLMGEAVYLRRPMLAVPIAGQFEHMLNARYLQREGYGLAADEIGPARLGQFLEALPEFERNLGRYRQDGNRHLLESLDRTLAAAVG
ncbi:MAG: teichoic acid biosynthesis protein [Deltaproteobacteria bacterium]|nr:teichoic acid biosynthesis protein [Deltaproteobacteria bacterium]